VQQMDEITQQTAANAEEAASASEELAAQAETTKEQIAILSSQVGGSADDGSSTYEKPSVRARAIAYTPVTNRANGNGNGNGNGSSEPEGLIPMGENRVVEQNDYMKDF